MHGPCGSANPNAPCTAGREDNTCKRRYPKPPAEGTIFARFPIYYQRRGAVHIDISGGRQISDRDIVPHNIALCEKYDCHINVEVAGSLESVKYLYKYVYKGTDRATVQVTNADEPEGEQAPQELQTVDQAQQLGHGQSQHQSATAAAPETPPAINEIDARSTLMVGV